jgi:hypothetical protein
MDKWELQGVSNHQQRNNNIYSNQHSQNQPSAVPVLYANSSNEPKISIEEDVSDFESTEQKQIW